MAVLDRLLSWRYDRRYRLLTTIGCFRLLIYWQRCLKRHDCVTTST